MVDYSFDAPFSDPIVRCCDCQKMLFRATLQKVGCCKKCGSRRVKAVLTLNDKEIDILKEKEVDPDYIALFTPIEDSDE